MYKCMSCYVSLYPALNNKKILIVEDVLISAEMLRQMLSIVGITAIIADNGKAGVEAFEKSSIGEYDAIITDIHMPVMDGWKEAEEIRSMQRSDAARIPIIALTSNIVESDVEMSKSVGINEHLGKPAEPKVIFETLNELIG